MIRFMIVEGFKSFFRAKFSNLLTIASVSLALCLVSIIAISSVSFESQLFRLKRETPMTLYFPNSTSEKSAKSIIQKIKEFEYISSVSFISKTKGMSNFDKLYNTDVKQIIGKNPLPHAAVIKLSKYDLSLKDFSTLKKKIKSIDTNINVIYNSRTFIKLERYIGYITKGSLALTGFVILISIILVINTIRLSIHDKRLIIRTMKLVGAKNRHIKSPFIFEAYLQGFISFGIVFGLIKYAEKLIAERFNYTLQYFEYQHIILCILAVLMTTTGARLSVRKYLKWDFK